MVALRGREIDAFLARPDPGRPIVLLYGPDAGLVRERADALLPPRSTIPTIRFRWSGSTATNSPPSRRGWSRKP